MSERGLIFQTPIQKMGCETCSWFALFHFEACMEYVTKFPYAGSILTLVRFYLIFFFRHRKYMAILYYQFLPAVGDLHVLPKNIIYMLLVGNSDYFSCDLTFLHTTLLKMYFIKSMFCNI